MKKKPKERDESTFKTFVGEVCEKLQMYFYLHPWQMTISWAHTEYHKDGQRQGAAKIEIDESYLTFTITVYRTALDIYIKEGPNKLLDILVHEFCHSVTDPLYKFAWSSLSEKQQEHWVVLNERQTEMINRVLTYADEIKDLAQLSS